MPFFTIPGLTSPKCSSASVLRQRPVRAGQNSLRIIFVDEIDAVGRQRGAGYGGSPNETETNQLLVEMDGFGDRAGVGPDRGHHRPDILDLALLLTARCIQTPDLVGRRRCCACT